MSVADQKPNKAEPIKETTGALMGALDSTDPWKYKDFPLSGHLAVTWHFP